jgi:hypothetical protein
MEIETKKGTISQFDCKSFLFFVCYLFLLLLFLLM